MERMRKALYVLVTPNIRWKGQDPALFTNPFRLLQRLWVDAFLGLPILDVRTDLR